MGGGWLLVGSAYLKADVYKPVVRLTLGGGWWVRPTSSRTCGFCWGVADVKAGARRRVREGGGSEGRCEGVFGC